MKLNLNTLLLAAILAFMAWYFFIKKVPAAPVVQTIANPDTGKPETVVIPAPAATTTIIEKVIERVIYRPQVKVGTKTATAPAKVTGTQLTDFTPTRNFWKGR